MAQNKLILCVCGGGINTSLNAKNKISEFLEKEGRGEIDVKHAMIGDIRPYSGRENMVVVWMTKIDETFDAPGIQGMAYLIGSKKAKEELTKKVISKIDEISK